MDRLYFVSFATIIWIDVFVRDQYFWEISQSLDFCRKERGMEIYCWCIMPSHVDLIFRSKSDKTGKMLGNMKKHTPKQMQYLITNNPTESRREWILWSPEVIGQKVDYIHNNPVGAGFVLEPWHWKYSSAIDYSGGKGLIEIDLI